MKVIGYKKMELEHFCFGVQMLTSKGGVYISIIKKNVKNIKIVSFVGVTNLISCITKFSMV